MNSVAFLECFEVSHDHFRRIQKIFIYIDRIWQWRHRSWPEVEKWTAQHKFFIDYDAKRIRSLSVTGFEKKIQNWPPLKKISTLVSVLYKFIHFYSRNSFVYASDSTTTTAFGDDSRSSAEKVFSLFGLCWIFRWSGRWSLQSKVFSSRFFKSIFKNHWHSKGFNQVLWCLMVFSSCGLLSMSKIE